MSDDFSAFFNAWKNIMEEPLKQLLCSWYIDKNWRLALLKIKRKDKREIAYKFAWTLMEELDIVKFNNLLKNFLDNLKNDEDTQDFYGYFSKHYAKRCNLWADCKTVSCGINTNLFLQAFHKVLKHACMKE